MAHPWAQLSDTHQAEGLSETAVGNAKGPCGPLGCGRQGGGSGIEPLL